MFVLVTLGAVTLVLGLFFLFAPGALAKFSEWMNKPVFIVNASSMTHRRPLGIFLIIFGLFLFLIAFS